MSRTEEDFNKRLHACLGRRYLNFVNRQVVINNCPFVYNWKHKVDFAIKNTNGEKLFIEVKGWMSMYAVNELRYLMDCSGGDFYILQVTNEDWISAYDKTKHNTIKAKIEANAERQYEEIKEFLSGIRSSKEMADISRQRLKDFIRLRNGDLTRWKRRLAKKMTESIANDDGGIQLK